MPITGLDDFVNELGATILTEAATALLDDLREKAPVATGELRDSAYGPDVDERDLVAVIGFDAEQADFTDVGVNPHDIYPRHANALTFFWPDGPDGARWYTFDHVNHPGQEGTGWFTDTIEETWEDQVQAAADAQ